MAVSNVELRVDARQAVNALRDVNTASGQASAATQQLTQAVNNSSAALTKTGRELHTAANGMRYFVDATGRARKENGQFVTTAEAAAAGIERQGRAARNASTSVATFSGAIGKLAGVFAAIQAVKFVIAKTSELETQTRSIETLTGSVEKAKQIIEELQQLGAATPFTSTELIDAAKRLNAFGVSAEKVVETTRRLGDVAGATGANLGELTLAYGQVIAKGRLQGEELLQFQERGIALQEELRKMYGLSGKEFQDALSKGRVSAEAVEVAIVRLTEKGGKYANGAVAQSTTLAGKFSTLIDGIESIARKIGEFLKPTLKEILDLANAVVDAINKSLAGPDYKKANDRLFNTRARIKELTAEIQAAEKAGINMQKGLQIQGVDGQVLGGGVPVLPNMRFELQQLQKEAKYLESRLKSLRQMTKSGAKAKTEPPPMLEGTDTKSRQTMDDLIGGAIKLRLEENKAALETQKLTALNGVALAENADQAQRMIDFQYQYRNIQLEINALQETLSKREQFRNQILSQAKDKDSARLALLQQDDIIRSQINVKQMELNTLAEQHKGKIIGAGEAERKLLEQQTKNGLERKQSLTDELELLQAKLNGNEAEVILKQQIRDILKDTVGLDAKTVEDQLNKINSLKKQLDIQTQIKGVADNIANTIGQGMTSAFDALIQGSESFGASLQRIASGVLIDIAKQLLQVFVIQQAINAIGGAIGGLLGGGGAAKSGPYPGVPFMQVSQFPMFRAKGGSVMAGQPYLVGERGPELFMPGRSGGIAPTGSFGGGVNVVVNVDASGTNVQGNNSDANQLGRVVSAAVQAELIKQQRPGGLLSGTR